MIQALFVTFLQIAISGKIYKFFVFNAPDVTLTRDLLIRRQGPLDVLIAY